MQLLCGLDIGTSACKAAVFTTEGELVAVEASAYPVFYPKSGWAEQNPLDWWRIACGCLKSVSLQTAQKGRIAAVAISGQSWSCIPVSRMGRVLGNTPIWIDTRSDGICERLMTDDIGKKLEETGKNPLSPTYTTAKVLWFKENMPDIYAETDKFLQSNAFIVYQLTGEIFTDLSQGYGTHFYDMATGKYNETLAVEAGIDLDKIPPLIGSHQIAGLVNLRAAAETGLLPGTPVIAGGLDAACAALGAGVVKEGMTQEQGGQSGGMSICMDSPIAHKSLILSNHVVPGKWLLQGGTCAGGAALRWASQLFDLPDYKLIDSEAADIPAGCAAPGGNGLLFLPYLMGERSPLWDKDVRGLFLGLDITHQRAHIFRAVMEGVAFSLRHNIETALEAGAAARRLYSTGGASRSRIWTRIKADITGLPISVPSITDAGALGAAMLAGVGAEIFPDVEAACTAMVKMGVTTEPDASAKARYDKIYGVYLDAYKQNRELFKRLSF